MNKLKQALFFYKMCTSQQIPLLYFAGEFSTTKSQGNNQSTTYECHCSISGWNPFVSEVSGVNWRFTNFEI